jgi:hypothetical protein
MDYAAEAKFYVRLTLVNPKAGQDERFSELTDDLLQFFSEQPGYVRGYKMLAREPDAPQGRIARLTVWSSEEDADRAATSQHVLSVRSELLQLIEEDSRLALSYTAYDPQLAKGAPGG